MKTNTYKLLRFPDAPNATGAAQEIDPLAMPASELEEPKFPLLQPDRVYRMNIVKAEETEAKTVNEKTGVKAKMWAITLATTKDEMDTEGKTLHTGAKVFARIMLTPGDSRSAKQIAEEAGMPVKAALGGQTKVSPRECINNPSLIEGKLVDVKIGIQKGKDSYPDSNVVKAWIIPS